MEDVEENTEPCYDAVASLYDRHWGHEFSPCAKAAFDEYLAPMLPRGSAVLDLCCGTGLFLAYIDQLGFAAYGVDESSKMMAFARENAPRARLVQADMAGFRTATRFQAIVSFYNSLNHARSLEHLGATLANVAQHLQPGGLFLFDYVLPEAYQNEWDCYEQIEGGDCSILYTHEESSGRPICLVNQQYLTRQVVVQPGEMRAALCAADLAVWREAPMAGAGPVSGRRLILARKQ